MNFNRHSDLEGQHAFLSASKYHWLNYDDDKIDSTYLKWQAAQRGTVLHEFAKTCILLGQKLQSSKKTLNMFVNDAIGFRMIPEQILYFSMNCFGTADAISFKKDFLRIHDLKTGELATSMNQLKIYTALFCLEYNIKPNEIGIENRIYQSNEIFIENPDPEEILMIEDKIIYADRRIERLKLEE